MTKRLSNALKKKLELSLTSLTARQAGRLFLIYSNEFFSNDETGILTDYPPVVELQDAWDKRVKASLSKKPIEAETVALLTASGRCSESFRKRTESPNLIYGGFTPLQLVRGQ